MENGLLGFPQGAYAMGGNGLLGFPVVTTPATQKPGPGARITDDAINTGLVGRWLCNEGRGSTLTDISGNGVDCTLYYADWGFGDRGAAVGFSGNAGSYGDFGSSAPLNVSYLTAYVRFLQRTGVGGQLLTKQATTVAGHSTYHIATNSSGYGVNVITTLPTTGASVGPVGPSPADYAWHDTALTYDVTDSCARLYVDGALIWTSSTTTNDGLVYDDFTNMYLGASYNSGVSSNSNFAYDSIGIWSRALSADEILALHANPYQGTQ